MVLTPSQEGSDPRSNLRWNTGNPAGRQTAEGQCVPGEIPLPPSKVPGADFLAPETCIKQSKAEIRIYLNRGLEMEFIIETEIECGSAVDLYSKDLIQNQLWSQGYVCI